MRKEKDSRKWEKDRKRKMNSAKIKNINSAKMLKIQRKVRNKLIKGKGVRR